MNRIIYQIALRSFTPEGTFEAATKLLEYVASLGADVVYVCPFFKEDTSPENQSRRQLESKTDNPKNPYRISDYFAVDEEYGTIEDVKAFADEAHRCGLEVMFDLVYLHAGPNAVFAKEHPEWFVRNDDGTVFIPDNWPFPRLNYSEKGLREYLISNMKYLISEFCVDGFRCDCGDYVPLDFWVEAFAECKKIKPTLYTLNEGYEVSYAQKAFDMMYPAMCNVTVRGIFKGELSAKAMRECYEEEVKTHGQNVYKCIRYTETHDTASDAGLLRNEITMTNRGVEAATVLTHTLPGIPFLWNGVEFCDDAENNMFSNRFCGKRSAINWSKAFSGEGRRRLEFIKKINNLYHNCTEVNSGDIEWIDTDCPEDVIAYVRSTEDKKVLVLINTRNKELSMNMNINTVKEYMKSGVTYQNGKAFFEPFGYLISEII